MSKKREKKEIKSLDLEIGLVQMEKFGDNFDNAMKKDLRSSFKKIVLFIGPFLLLIIGYMIFKIPVLLTIGASITGVGVIITLAEDFIKNMRSLKSNKHITNSNIINIEQEKDADKILEEGIGKAKGEDFYSEKFKYALEKSESYVETEEEKKYKEAVERQQQKQKNKNYPNLKIVETDANYLDKEATMIQIIREIDAYTFVYNLPPVEISNEQWNLFFDITYNFFLKKRIENKFYNFMSQVGRFVFAKSLVNKKNTINIYDFVKNLYYLENEEIKKQEIAILQQDILSKLPSAKIINVKFSDYTTEKRRK